MLILGTIASEFMQMNVSVHRWRVVFTRELLGIVHLCFGE